MIVSPSTVPRGLVASKFERSLTLHFLPFSGNPNLLRNRRYIRRGVVEIQTASQIHEDEEHKRRHHPHHHFHLWVLYFS